MGGEVMSGRRVLIVGGGIAGLALARNALVHRSRSRSQTLSRGRADHAGDVDDVIATARQR